MPTAAADPPLYVHHALSCAPRAWATVTETLTGSSIVEALGGDVYGIWRAQIGLPRDELTLMTVWPSRSLPSDLDACLQDVADVRSVRSQTLSPTLRPATPDAPRRQGNFAFRWFDLPERHFTTFLSLCEQAWPGFEAAYDSQVLGLWRARVAPAPGSLRALLLTRRPNLAMWERSKQPADAAEAEVRRKLSERYDLCDATWVATTTLLTATDTADYVRWA